MSTIEEAIARLRALQGAGVTMEEPRSSPTRSPRSETGPGGMGADGLETSQSAPHPHPHLNPNPLVEIDLPRLRSQGLLTPDAPRTRLADEYRVIKRPVIENARGRGASLIKNANLVMVTSALPGEGKSFSSVNLAISLAKEQDTTVLLVDADVARPSVMRMFGLPPSRGLMDVVSGEAEVGDVLLRTSIEKLSLLPAGMPHERATEMLASRAMQAVLSEIAGRYENRIVVFDSPPLLATTEARVLASHMGQVVMVVEARRTSVASVRQALATIQACPVKLLMLNKGASADKRAYGGQAAYGYGYGNGYGAAGSREHDAYGYGAPL